MSAEIATSRQQRQAKTASRSGQVTGALKIACDHIVHDGLSWELAAEKAGLKIRSMRLALGRPHVLNYIKDEKAILLATISAQNPKRLAELRDQNENKAAAVRAAATLEEMSGAVPSAGPGRVMSPGLVIVIQPAMQPQPKTINSEAVESD